MTEAARAFLGSLPDVVTIYRGGRQVAGRDAPAPHQGLHWAVDRSIAATYMERRGRETTISMIKDLSRSLHLAFAMGGGARPNLNDNLGTPFLIEAVVPKNMILAYYERGVDGACTEVIVDFEKLTPDMMRHVTFSAFRWAS
jgi:hypothetical protein